MDRLTGMEVFTRVVDAGSFAAAANKLGLSRAMVSKHIAELEERLGTRLLHRTTRRVSVTESGRAFYDRCREILMQLDEAEREAANLHLVPRGLLRINAPMSFGVRHIAPLIPDYLQRYPDVRLDMAFTDRRVDLVEDGYDMAVRIGQLADSSLVAKKLAPCRMVVCAAPAYLAARGVPRTPAELAEHECLTYTYWLEGDEWRFSDSGGDHAVKVSGRFVANNGDAVTAAAAVGLGLILQPTFMTAEHVAAGRLEVVLADYRATELGVYAVYPKPGPRHRRVPAKVRTFIEFLAERFGAPPYWDAPFPF